MKSLTDLFSDPSHLSGAPVTTWSALYAVPPETGDQAWINRPGVYRVGHQAPMLDDMDDQYRPVD